MKYLFVILEFLVILSILENVLPKKVIISLKRNREKLKKKKDTFPYREHSWGMKSRGGWETHALDKCKIYQITLSLSVLRLNQNSTQPLIKIWDKISTLPFLLSLSLSTHRSRYEWYKESIWSIERDIFREDEIRREERGRGNIRFLGNPLLPPPPPSSLLSVRMLVFYFAVVLTSVRNVLDHSTRNAECI